ncbi:MAG: hypothetical protein KAR79_00095 [Simkaniaceae bacterium]|nr:hypothetical protein [Simkaniaceae bacterium]
MKKVLITAAIALGCQVALQANDESEMKLFNQKTGFVVAEFHENSIVFHDRYLEAEMKDQGIAIPPAMRDLFHGKAVVKMGDKEFPQAFKEIYYSQAIDMSVFHWDTDTYQR